MRPSTRTGQEASAARDLRLVAFDLDGTVLDATGRPDPHAMDTVRDLLARGMHLASISGRSIRRSLQALGGHPDIAAAIHICGYNGAAAVAPEHAGRRELLFATRLKQAVLDELTEYTVQWDFNLVYCRCDDSAAGLLEDYRFLRTTGPGLSTADWNGAGYVLDPDLVHRLRRREFGPPPKVMIFAPAAVREKALAHLHRRFAGRIYVAWARPELLEVMAPTVDKGIALQRLARRLGLSLDQTAAIGDGNNDLPMLRRAGIGLLMGDAADGVRQALAGTGVTEVLPFARGGFARAMHDHVLSRPALFSP